MGCRPVLKPLVLLLSSSKYKTLLVKSLNYRDRSTVMAQPYNDFFAIKRIVVPLTLEPTLSQQHETCLLLFYGWVRGRLFYCLLWVVIVFFIMILVSWLSDDSLFHICLFTSSLLLIWLILLWFWKKRHSAVLLFFSRDEATFSLIGIHWKSRTLSQQI